MPEKCSFVACLEKVGYIDHNFTVVQISSFLQILWLYAFGHKALVSSPFLRLQEHPKIWLKSRDDVFIKTRK